MHCRMSGSTWKFVACLAIVGVLFATSGAFAVDKMVRVSLAGAGATESTVTFDTVNGLHKLGPAEDGHYYISTPEGKLSLHFQTGDTNSHVEVALPDVANVGVEVTLDGHGQATARVVTIPVDKDNVIALPGATSPNLVTPGAQIAVQSGMETIRTAIPAASGEKGVVSGATKGQSNPSAGPRGPIANDNCAAADPVGDGVTAFDTTGATTDGPALPAGCEEGFGLSFEQDIWYCYTASCDGQVTVTLCGSGYDTRMAVYDGCACPPTTLVACNDDFCGLQSQLSFLATSGNTYLIRVGGFGAAQGAGTMDISCQGVSGGGGSDDCGSAEAITGEGNFAFDNSAATTDGLPHASCFFFGEDQIENDVWYCWTATCDGDVRIETCGLTGVDTKIAVYNGCDTCPPTDADKITCNDDACSLQSRVTFSATSGNEYLIRVGNYPGAAAGTGQINITCVPPPMEICTQTAGNCQGRDVSDARNSTRGVFVTAENFVPAANSSITELCWWGTYGSGSPTADSFEVRYYAEAGGVPGALIAGPFSQTGGSLVVAGPSATGNLIAGVVPEFAYTGTHAAVPVLADTCYWVEITNGTTTQSWFWEVSPPGNGRAAQKAGAPGGYTPADMLIGVDLAVCFDIALGNPAICLPPPATNDDCDQCESIVGEGTFAFDNSAATTDGPPHAACFFFGEDQLENDVWFCWEAPCSGLVLVETCGLTGVDTKLAVYSGTACPVDDGRLLACNDDACGLQSGLSFNAVSGQMYLIRIGNYPGAAPGVGSFRITCLGTAPCNEPAPNCHTRDVSNAFNSTRDVFHAADDFTPDANGNVTGLCWWGTYFDGAGDCRTSGPDNFRIRYFADSGSFLPGALLATFSQGGGTLTVSAPFQTGNVIAGIVPEYEYSATHAAVPVLAGQCYWVEITNFNSATCSWFWEIGGGGNLRAVQDNAAGGAPNGYDAGDAIPGVDLAFCLNLALGDESICAPPPPPGDLCDDAIAVAVPSVTAGDTSGSGVDAAPFCGTSISAGGVWYTVIGTGNTITASTCAGTPYDSKLNVYCGPCNNLTCVTGIDDFCGLQSQVSWCSQAGALYRILVQGFGGATGPFTLTITDDGVPCVASVQCAASGGCCIEGDCIVTTADGCAEAGGDYLGDNTNCAPTGGTTVVFNQAVNTAIPDATPAGVSSVINVPNSFTIDDVDVDLSVTHTWVGDLCVTLSHGATTVNLIRRMGDNANTCHTESPFGCGEDNLNGIILDDEGASPIEAACQANLTSPPNYIPNEALSAFDGQDAAGAWTITVSDNAGLDTGTFVSWSLHFNQGGESPCEEVPCDTCPPGTIPLTDGDGDFSGWCASVSHPNNVTITTIDTNLSQDRVTISIEKDFKEGPGFGGMIPAILIDFVQVCPDAQTANNIEIAAETIHNNTGVDWRDFHWYLFDGPESWFDVEGSGLGVAPFTNRLFSRFLDPGTLNQAKALAAYNGLIVNGSTWNVGGGGAPLRIGVDLSLTDRASVTLKEVPTLDGVVIAGGCCLGLECVFVTEADCQASGGNYLGDDVLCSPAACLPQNDLCENCISVQTGVPYNGTTDGSTGTDITSCAFNDTIDVWHCWTATCTGNATFSLCGSAYDTTLAVFGSCSGPELACNDDSSVCGAGSLQSHITLAVTSGTTYYIRVSGFNGLTGNYTLNVNCPPPSSGGTGGLRPGGARMEVIRR